MLFRSVFTISSPKPFAASEQRTCTVYHTKIRTSRYSLFHAYGTGRQFLQYVKVRRVGPILCRLIHEGDRATRECLPKRYDIRRGLPVAQFVIGTYDVDEQNGDEKDRHGHADAAHGHDQARKEAPGIDGAVDAHGDGQDDDKHKTGREIGRASCRERV